MELDIPLKNFLRTTSAHLKKLEKLGIFTVRDLLEFYPRTIESSEVASNFNSIRLGEKNTISGTLHEIRTEKSPRKNRRLGRATLKLDDDATIEVIWFQIPYLLRNLRENTRVFLVGKIARSFGKIQISNPEIHLDRNVHVGKIRAIYPESPPITSKWLREKIADCLALAPEFPEILPPEILKSENFPSKTEAVRAMHAPDSLDDWKNAKRRLAFEEIFTIQTRVILAKIQREKSAKNSFHAKFDPESVKSDLKKLPFELTLAQKKVLLQILKDFEKPRPAHRLVQGDVGSGKTIVAFLAANAIARAGFQTAILAPTEVLAKQHFTGATKFWGAGNNKNLPTSPISDLGKFDADAKSSPLPKIALLTGSTPAREKTRIKNDLRTGKIQILIGTHAILTEDTVFRNLGLAVIDEQHRFGVEQRAILAKNNCHQIAMTATPIPRTLALTIYGDQDISIIDEMPAGRKKIITRVVADEKTRILAERFIDDQIEKGRQIFWICPLIDESDKIEAKNVRHEYDRIANIVFPTRRVQFLHGKMKPREKDEIMTQFKNREFDILVSTSVIEVGVDIQNATVMIIENSERFGLAQLHQFRGRIGRNSMQSYCFLMTGKKDDANRERLRAMERSNSGFDLAEIDLKLRGAGEVYGKKQSGLPDLKCADLADVATLEKARNWATKIAETDPTLQKHEKLKKAVEKEVVFF